MKKIMFVLLMILLVVPLVSAADWDNVLDYENNDLTVKITNWLGLFGWLGLDDRIGTAELKSHSSVNYVRPIGAGNQVVMWYDFSFIELYLNGLGNVEFTDVRTGEETDRNYSFVYWGEKERNVYDQKCFLAINGTQTCERFVIGKETYNIWLPYNSKDIPKGNMRIGLRTYVEVGDNIDGVWTITGKKVKKHAEWTESLNVGLILALELDEGGGDFIDAHNDNDFTNDGASNVTGVINSAYEFEKDEGDQAWTKDAVDKLDDAASISVSVSVKLESYEDTIICADPLDNTRDYFCLRDPGKDGTINWYIPDWDNVETSVLATGVWWDLLGTYDDATNNLTIYVNGVINATKIFVGSLGSDPPNITFAMTDMATGLGDFDLDLVRIWNVSLTPAQAVQLYNGGNRIGYSVEILISLLLPEDNANLTIQTINFSANVSDLDALGIQNVSLIINGIINQTNSSRFEGVYNFSDTFADGDYNWSIIAYDDTDVLYETFTRDFALDATSPVINIIYPNETITFHKLNTNLSLNWSINDTNLDSCWFNWNSSNVSITCNDNSTAFNITDGTVKTLTLYANDTFGNEVSQTVTWNYRLFLNYEIYDEEIIEGLSTIFSANFLTNGSTITLANLSYNSSGNTGTINNHGGNNFTVTKTITALSVSEKTNILFYWNITQGIMYHALDPKNQTILNLGIDNCTANSEVLYNFTIVDERTQTELIAAGNNTDAKIDIEIRGFGTSTIIEQYNGSYSQINPFAVCFNSTEGKFNIDVQIQYNADGYEIEFYHIQNATIDSTDFPTNITLFDLNTTKSQLFKLIVKDSSFLAIGNALVEVHRKYIEEGVFKIVEIPRTDAKGETAAHLVIQDAIYNFIIKKYGVTIITFENVIAVCQTPLVTPCVIDFNAFAETIEVPDFEEAEDFLFTLGFNSTSRVISSVFSIPSGIPSVVTIEVIKEDALGTSICTDTLTSSSGTLTCNVGANIGNSTILAKLYKDGNLQAQGNVKLDQNPFDIYGGVLIILGLFIMMTLIGAGISDNPVYTVLFLMVGVILLFALKLVSSEGFIGGSILWLIIAIILLIIKGGRRS